MPCFVLIMPLIPSVLSSVQKVSDLKGATNILNVTKHLSEEAALNGVFWAYQSEEAREELHNHVTVTDQFLAGFVSWSPTPCAESLTCVTNCSSPPIIAHDKVLAAVLAVKLPGLGHVMQGDDASAALAVMTSILTFVEERAHKHQAFVLQQQGAACVLAAVSCDSSFSWWPVYRIADLALDLMTSFLDIEICMTPDPDRRLQPRFGLHTGQI
nr:hypothetical protein BaRGS_016692 [Batillaria attramentaria]